MAPKSICGWMKFALWWLGPVTSGRLTRIRLFHIEHVLVRTHKRVPTPLHITYMLEDVLMLLPVPTMIVGVWPERDNEPESVYNRSIAQWTSSTKSSFQTKKHTSRRGVCAFTWSCACDPLYFVLTSLWNFPVCVRLRANFTLFRFPLSFKKGRGRGKGEEQFQ